MMFELPVSRCAEIIFRTRLCDAPGSRTSQFMADSKPRRQWPVLKIRQSIIPGPTPGGLKKWLCSNNGGLV